MYEFDCDFFGTLALLWVSGPNKWQSFTGSQQGQDCVFSVSNISSEDKVAIGFDLNFNKAWYIFSRAGTCTQIADDHGWMYLTPGCSASVSVQKPTDPNNIKLSIGAREVVFDLTNRQLLEWRVEIFNLAGERLFDGGANTAGQVRWSLTTNTGSRVPNGTYFYIITVRGPNGEIKHSKVKKLVVLY
ncbi:MAG TPA: gliding motility-associated C-terminal domain-containing protein [Patescibacteria group bacterium]|nr:gliding motility-associated C-terminal domain-containing protein [Patescibacteria group bacterium]